MTSSWLLVSMIGSKIYQNARLIIENDTTFDYHRMDWIYGRLCWKRISKKIECIFHFCLPRPFIFRQQWRLAKIHNPSHLSSILRRVVSIVTTNRKNRSISQCLSSKLNLNMTYILWESLAVSHQYMANKSLRVGKTEACMLCVLITSELFVGPFAFKAVSPSFQVKRWPIEEYLRNCNFAFLCGKKKNKQKNC